MEHVSLPLAGLILTDDDGPVTGATARVLLPVAGQTLIEYQARIARACGAGHIVVLVDRMPALLVAAFDRLRADGIDVDIARDAGEVADRIHPDEQLLVIAGGVVAGRSIVESLVENGAPILLTVDDTTRTSHFERIDARDRWGGLALLDGKLLRETAAILGDWTLGPTLLRAALQAGAGRLSCSSDGLALVQGAEDAQMIAHVLATGNGRGGDGFWQSRVVAPVVRRMLPQLVSRDIPPDIMEMLPLGLMAIALLSAGFDWISAGFGFFLLIGFPAAAARIMTDVGARPDKTLRWVSNARLPVLFALLGLSGWSLAVPGSGWGPLVLAVWAGIALLLQPRSDVREAWYADADLIALEMLVASLIGQPVMGLMTAVVHAVFTQFWLVRRSA